MWTRSSPGGRRPPTRCLHGRSPRKRCKTSSRKKRPIRARGTVAHVSAEKSTPAEAYVLDRGEYDRRKDRVTPATPASLPPMPADLPRNRLGYAKWLLRPENIP